MDNTANVTIIAHFNSFVIKNTEQGVIFMSNEQTYFFVPQTMSFEELNVGLCQAINIDTQKRVMRIRYRYPVSNLNSNI